MLVSSKCCKMYKYQCLASERCIDILCSIFAIDNRDRLLSGIMSYRWDFVVGLVGKPSAGKVFTGGEARFHMLFREPVK